MSQATASAEEQRVADQLRQTIAHNRAATQSVLAAVESLQGEYAEASQRLETLLMAEQHATRRGGGSGGGGGGGMGGRGKGGY